MARQKNSKEGKFTDLTIHADIKGWHSKGRLKKTQFIADGIVAGDDNENYFFVGTEKNFLNHHHDEMMHFSNHCAFSLEI